MEGTQNHAPGLLSMPHKVLNIIVGNLCLHCHWEATGSPSFRCDEAVEPKHNPFHSVLVREHQKALDNLSKTCTRLRDVATPYLYHCPQPLHGRRAWPLVRTLVQRPDLAQCVQMLNIVVGWYWGYDGRMISISERDKSLLTHLIRQLDLRSEEDLDPGPSYPPMPCLATSLAPNLTTLLVAAGNKQGISLLNNSTLNRLKTLKIMRCDYEYQLRPHTSFQQLLPVPRRHASEAHAPSFPSVSTLHISNKRISPQQYQRLFESTFPNLERFVWEMDGMDEVDDSMTGFSVINLYTPLQAVKDTLIHLKLDLEWLHNIINDGQETLGETGNGALRHLTNLETLDLNIRAPKDASWEFPKHGNFASFESMLPPSLLALRLPDHLLLHRDPSKVLADAIENELPHLELIGFHENVYHISMEKYKKEVYEALAEFGVEKVPGDKDLWEYV